MTWEQARVEEILIRLLKAESEPDSDKEAIISEIMPFLEGMQLKIHRYENNGNPAIFAASPQPEIMLSGHLDTVKIDPESSRGAGEIEGDKIYGRGALDMKGPCLSMLMAAENILESGHGVALAFTTDEEMGMAGARQITANHPEIAGIPMIVVCEPTAMVPVIEEKGLLELRIKVQGKSAHASLPEAGVSAIDILVKGLRALRNSGRFGGSSEEPVTLNIGKISGGALVNMIASQAEAEIDMRYSPDHSEEELYELVRDLTHPDDNIGASATLETIREFGPVRSKLPENILGQVENMLGPSAKVPYATEMVVFSEVNKRIMILGPGQVDLAHTRNEWMSISQLIRAAEFYPKLLSLV